MLLQWFLMYQKTVELEEGYSKERDARIKMAFAELKEFKNSPSVMALPQEEALRA